MTFASRLRALRQSRGLTQQQLSERVGITIGQLSRYENGLQPSIAAIVSLAQVLQVDPRELAEPVITHAAANSPTRTLVTASGRHHTWKWKSARRPWLTVEEAAQYLKVSSQDDLSRCL